MNTEATEQDNGEVQIWLNLFLQLTSGELPLHIQCHFGVFQCLNFPDTVSSRSSEVCAPAYC
jgi:hypothetical protein